MKLYSIIILSIVLFFALSCGGEESKTPTPLPDLKPILTLSTPSGERGYVYLNGKYTGKMAPCDLKIKKGKHIVGIALSKSMQYLRKEVNVSESAALSFTNKDIPTPKKWKALWVGVSETTADGCSTKFSKDEMDAGYEYFNWSIKEHFQKYSYNTMAWEVDRKDISVPVEVAPSGSGFVLEPYIFEKYINVKPGEYDCIFVFWRESYKQCSLSGKYLGLGWTNPIQSKNKTGYVTIKFPSGSETIQQRLDQFKKKDPGMWIHEWLHTIGEIFFETQGSTLPGKAGDGLRVHAAGDYGYNFPWMNWYLDFVSARIKSKSSNSYVGIGPEVMLGCSVRDVANGSCK